MFIKSSSATSSHISFSVVDFFSGLKGTFSPENIKMKNKLIHKIQYTVLKQEMSTFTKKIKPSFYDISIIACSMIWANKNRPVLL